MKIFSNFDSERKKEAYKEIVEKYGEEKLKEIAKVNFKNTDRILHTMIY